jgi:hypothetical protein
MMCTLARSSPLSSVEAFRRQAVKGIIQHLTANVANVSRRLFSTSVLLQYFVLPLKVAVLI